MKTRTRTFDWSHALPGQPALASEGWKPTGTPEDYYPGPGFLAAHDTVEHLSNKSDWAHELRAAGATLYSLHGQGTSRSVMTVAEDVTGFAGAMHRWDAPQAPSRWANGKNDPEVLNAFASDMRRLIFRRAGNPDFVAKAMPWVRLGYRAAERIWGKGNGLKVGHLMSSIADAINMDHDDHEPQDGDKLTVTVDTKARTFKITRSPDATERKPVFTDDPFMRLLMDIRGNRR